MTLLIGVLTINETSIANARVNQTEVSSIVTPDVFKTLALTLYDVRLVGLRQLEIYTNDKLLRLFLTPPIKVAPTTVTKVKPLFKPYFPLINVPTGGSSNQWEILFNLMYFNRWKIRYVTKLENTEALYAEYITCRDKAGAPRSARRLDEGVWTAA